MEFLSGKNAYQQEFGNLGLSKDQKDFRSKGIGGSDAKLLWEGKWAELYDRINGESEDLSEVFKVQLGHVTEKFNILWNAKVHDFEVAFPGGIAHENFQFIRCHVDAIGKDAIGEFVIDAKHTAAQSPWWGPQEVAEYYYWQAQHNMLATGIGRFALTPIWGNELDEMIFIGAVPDHQEEYLERAQAFWWHIENNERPEDVDSGKAKIEISLDDMRVVDMTEGNTAETWRILSETYKSTKNAHKEHEAAKKGIKELIADDVKLASGHGIEASRNKRGAITIKEV